MIRIKQTFKLIPGLVILSGACAKLTPVTPTPIKSDTTSTSAISQAPLNRPPLAEVHETKTTYFGHEVVDPYAWMETPKSEPLMKWVTKQDNHTRNILSRLPVAAEMRHRMESLFNDIHDVRNADQSRHTIFFLDRAVGKTKPTLQVRDEKLGTSRILVDIEQSSKTSIDYFYPSPNGTYVAYGVSEGGSENSELHILNVNTGIVIMPAIDRCRYANVVWLWDESGFYYRRDNPRDINATSGEQHNDVAMYFHRFGTSIQEDKVTFGRGGPGSEFAEEYLVPSLTIDRDSRLAIIATNHNVLDPFTVLVGRNNTKGEVANTWKKIAEPESNVIDLALRKDVLYVLTGKDAPRHRIERWRLNSHGAFQREVFFESPVAILESVAAARDGLFVTAQEDGLARLFYVPYKDGQAKAIPLPQEGSIPSISVTTNNNEALFRFESWTRGPRWLKYNEGVIQDTGLETTEDFSDIEVRRVQVQSHDGALVPLTVLYPKGMVWDGRNPTMLFGYGAFGISLKPYFRPWRRAWYEKGGVIAFAHVRGGGEKGELWHKAGQKENKQNSILDLIACAEELIQLKVATPKTLGLYGGSAGGILLNGAVVQRPDLFAAAVVEVGYANMVNLEHGQAGGFHSGELGSVKTKEGFQSLLAMDAYLQVKDNVPYPSMLFITGMNDPRVSPWHSFKMAARLQAATSSGNDIFLRVGFDEGHGLSSTKSQNADMLADICSFLFTKLTAEGSAQESKNQP